MKTPPSPVPEGDEEVVSWCSSCGHPGIATSCLEVSPLHDSRLKGAAHAELCNLEARVPFFCSRKKSLKLF